MDDIAPAPGKAKDYQILWAEMKHISWGILRHLAILAMLTSRLLVLPVTFWYAKLNLSVHSVVPAAWHFVKYMSIALLSCVPLTVQQHPITTGCIFHFRRASALIRQAVRVIQALYDLGLLLDENPELLGPRRVSSTRLLSDRRKSVSHTSPEGITQHATASQVYHAALANDHNTLDDLLAGFSENTESSVSTRGHRRISVNPKIDCQRCRQRARYRNSSIQTTPERMFTPLPQPFQTRVEQSEITLELEGSPSSDHDGTVTEISPETEILPTGMTSASLPSMSDSATVKQLEVQIADDDKASMHSHESKHSPEGCPREMAKQAQSRLPRRRSSPPGLSSQGSAEGSSDKRRSTAIIEPLTPTRKGKLQRRPRTPRM